MRGLTTKEIEALSTREGVSSDDIKELLSSMGNDYEFAWKRMVLLARLRKWNMATCQAAVDGLLLAAKKEAGGKPDIRVPP